MSIGSLIEYSVCIAKSKVFFPQSIKFIDTNSIIFLSPNNLTVKSEKIHEGHKLLLSLLASITFISLRGLFPHSSSRAFRATPVYMESLCECVCAGGSIRAAVVALMTGGHSID